jgi:hypothetical protein
MILRAINEECEPRKIERPSLQDVTTAVQRLDGKTRTLVTLEAADDHHLAVGGGGGRYIVYVTLDNIQFKNLIIPGKSGPKVILTCGGQEGDFAAKQCVDLDAATRAAETFALTGQPDPELAWEDG